MESLAENGTCDAFEEAVSRFVVCHDGMTNGEALSRVFSYMKKSYRNEYVYKSLLLKKIVYGRHSPKTSSAICELPVADSIADFVLVNGKACVYEIKTELDNCTRLSSQLRDYYRAFRYVSVVCSENAAPAMLETLKDSPVGLMILSGRLTFRTLVEPRCWGGEIDPLVQFDLLRKSEREAILLECGADLPSVPPVHYYTACFEIFEKLSATLRMRTFERVLKARGRRIKQDALAIYPEEYKLIAYNHGASLQQGKKLMKFAQSNLV